jgi:DNA-binding GntR family transcriptional regulator
MPDELPWSNRSRLVDEIQDYLREAIYVGRYAPGTRLRQEQLAEELNVSRTPLREAMRVLQHEGLLRPTRGNGVEVVQVDARRLLDACLLRELVDGLAARLTAARRPDGIGAQLTPLLEVQRRALDPWDVGTFVDADVELHTLLLRASGNDFLMNEMPLIRLTAQVFLPVTHFDEARAVVVISEHERIVAAVVAGDEMGAELCARAHVRATIGALTTGLAESA